MKTSRRTVLAAAAAFLSFGPTGRASGDQDEARAIVAVMRGTWDRPDAPLAVWPVVVRDDRALAGWTQGELGGLALLRRDAGGWSVLLCANDHLATETALLTAEVPAGTALRLAAAWSETIRTADREIVAKFTRFEGIVRMDGTGHHPPGPAHGTPAAHGSPGPGGSPTAHGSHAPGGSSAPHDTAHPPPPAGH